MGSRHHLSEPEQLLFGDMGRTREEYPSGRGFASPPRRLADIETEGGALVRTALKDRKQRPEALRRLAELIVDLRRYFTDEDGEIDWRGRSWEYRERVRDLFDAWGVPADSEENFQASLRYHVGNYLREVLTPSELIAAGLQPAGPRQRLQNSRDELRAIVQAITHSEVLEEGDLPTLVALDSALRLVLLVEGRDEDLDRKAKTALRKLSKTCERMTA